MLLCFFNLHAIPNRMENSEIIAAKDLDLCQNDIRGVVWLTFLQFRMKINFVVKPDDNLGIYSEDHKITKAQKTQKIGYVTVPQLSPDKV